MSCWQVSRCADFSHFAIAIQTYGKSYVIAPQRLRTLARGLHGWEALFDISGLGFGAWTGDMSMFTFDTKCKNGTKVSSKIETPKTAEEWVESGMVLNMASVMELVRKSWIIAFQANLRKMPTLEVEDFTFGVRMARTTVVIQKVRIDAGELSLNREQIDALVEGGAEVHNIPEGI